MKLCKSCGVKKNESEFYPITNNSDGLSGSCKECTKARIKARYYRDIDKIKEYERKRAKLPHRKAAAKEYQSRNKEIADKCRKRYIKKYPSRRAAHIETGNAVRDGKLIKQPCVICGETKVQAHHNDYSKPLEVVWLCIKHHNQVHGKCL